MSINQKRKFSELPAMTITQGDSFVAKFYGFEKIIASYLRTRFTKN